MYKLTKNEFIFDTYLTLVQMEYWQKNWTKTLLPHCIELGELVYRDYEYRDQLRRMINELQLMENYIKLSPKDLVDRCKAVIEAIYHRPEVPQQNESD